MRIIHKPYGSETRKVDIGEPYEPVVCVDCHTYFLWNRFSGKEQQWLKDQYDLEESQKERRLLLQVAALCERHREIAHVNNTPDPTAVEKWRQWSGSSEPLEAWLEAYKEAYPDAEPFRQEETEAVQYLRHVFANYAGRAEWLGKEIVRLSRLVPGHRVTCPSCRTGRLVLDPDLWGEEVAYISQASGASGERT